MYATGGGFVLSGSVLLVFACRMIWFVWEVFLFKIGRRLTPVGTLTNWMHDFMVTHKN
jgi:hypothetical protein